MFRLQGPPACSSPAISTASFPTCFSTLPGCNQRPSLTALCNDHLSPHHLHSLSSSLTRFLHSTITIWHTHLFISASPVRRWVSCEGTPCLYTAFFCIPCPQSNAWPIIGYLMNICEKNEFNFLRQCVCLNIRNTVVFKIAALWWGEHEAER